jgi:hypothetical protein
MARTRHKNQTKPEAASNSAPAKDTAAGNAPASNTPAVNSPASNPQASNTPAVSSPGNNASANSPSPAITLALISGAVAILTAIIALVDPQIITSFLLRTPVTPTATSVPFARIQSLNIIHEDGTTETVNLGEKIILPIASNVMIQVNFVTNTGKENLVVHWEFCHPEKNTRGHGAVEIPYKLSEEGTDCINVKIERDGQFLHTANFFVNAEK